MHAAQHADLTRPLLMSCNSYCGDKGQAATAETSTQCNLACPGDLSTNCGGPNALVIFDSLATPPAPIDPKAPIFLDSPFEQWRDSRFCLVDNGAVDFAGPYGAPHHRP